MICTQHQGHPLLAANGQQPFSRVACFAAHLNPTNMQHVLGAVLVLHHTSTKRDYFAISRPLVDSQEAAVHT